MAFTIISAGAGSGKTYRLTQEMVKKLNEGYPAAGIIATTFTQKAASELQSRVRIALLKIGLRQEAEALTNALIGTVHSLGIKLLQRFAFEAGVSPIVNIITEGEPQYYFNLAMTSILTPEKVEKMEELSRRLTIIKDENNGTDWRNIVKNLTDIARSNNFSAAVLRESAKESIATQLNLLEPPEMDAEAFDSLLLDQIKDTLHKVSETGDVTKVTSTSLDKIKKVKQLLENNIYPPWEDWARLSKLDAGVKSKEAIKEMTEFAASHIRHPRFHADISAFIHEIFELAIEAMQEYSHFKTQRGLIDYTDMEVKVDELLDNPTVCDILRSEISILMVDEFQDTSPIQLSIFLKLSQIAKHTIWVGDPKQSIYGFRGAEPSLMKAIIDKNGGVKPEDVQGNSYRSRQDLVHCVNAIFVRGFSDMPSSQVELQPIRTKESESDLFGPALNIWELNKNEDGKKQKFNIQNVSNSLAHSLQSLLQKGIYIKDDQSGEMRKAQAGDVAILCKTNNLCLGVAASLKMAGLNAAVSQPGIFDTVEGILILACLKYVQSKDEIALTEILLYGEKMSLEALLHAKADRQRQKANDSDLKLPEWGLDYPLTRKLIALRKNRKYLSVFEILDQLISSLDLKRLIVEWGNPDQRLDNIDQIRSIALKYEESCKSLHIATSLSGFIFWCQRKIETNTDLQGAGEGPDSVRVLTYHRSKGLEWPIVILLDLDKEVNTKINNLTIVPKNNTIDLSNILGNRWVRLWINPYGKNNKKTVLWDNIEKSPEWDYQNKQDLAEEIRIFYVGFTRARDYLILPYADKNLSVINRIWNKDLEELNLLDLNSEKISIPWKNENLPFNILPMRFIDQTPEVVREYASFLYTEAAKGEVDHITKLIQYEDLSGIKEITTTFNIIEKVTIWEDLNTENWSQEEKEHFKMAMAAFINAWHPDEESYRIKILSEDLLKEFSLTNRLPATFFIEVSDRLTSLVAPLFFDFIGKNHLITSYIAQREYNFDIPMVIESEQENIFFTLINILDSKSVEELLEDHKNKLAFENELIKRNKGSENIQNWVLLVSKGTLVKIDWTLKDSLEEIINNL